jgi:hypothetical protein
MGPWVRGRTLAENRSHPYGRGRGPCSRRQPWGGGRCPAGKWGGRSVGMTEFILGVRNKVAVQQDDLGAVEELRGKLMSAHWT